MIDVRVWQLVVRGGPYDGMEVAARVEQPGKVLVLWRCHESCDGHGTFDPDEPRIVLRTAEAYRRVALDDGAALAVYEQGETVTEDEPVAELVGVGADEPELAA